MNDSPAISVIIPVYNARATLARCLRAVFDSNFNAFEVILVDDCSTDGSLDEVDGFPCRTIRLERNLGAGGARNRGVELATGEILFFLDADVLAENETLRQVVESFDARPEIAALFGSYQKNTVPGNFTSDYKNLLHHYTHQNSREEAATFCGGFGAIRREVFAEYGGFDEQHRSLEDIELGYRLHLGGCRIYLNKALQLTHCKKYTLRTLIASDLFCRAIPWTRLMLTNGIFRSDMNTQSHNVLSVIAAYLMLSLVPLLWILPIAGGSVFLALAAWFLWLNRKFFRFIFQERGVFFTARTVALNWFGYLYSGCGLVIGVALFVRDWLSRVARRPAKIKLPVSTKDGRAL
jgi:glycosyltransferase involved in cell wall biosynthesis